MEIKFTDAYHLCFPDWLVNSYLSHCFDIGSIYPKEYLARESLKPVSKMRNKMSQSRCILNGTSNPNHVL